MSGMENSNDTPVPPDDNILLYTRRCTCSDRRHCSGFCALELEDGPDGAAMDGYRVVSVQWGERPGQVLAVMMQRDVPSPAVTRPNASQAKLASDALLEVMWKWLDPVRCWAIAQVEYHGTSMEGIARHLGVTVQRANALEKQGLWRLRCGLQAKGVLAMRGLPDDWIARLYGKLSFYLGDDYEREWSAGSEPYRNWPAFLSKYPDGLPWWWEVFTTEYLLVDLRCGLRDGKLRKTQKTSATRILELHQ